MVSLYALKPAFQTALRPQVGKLARLGVTANQVTIAAAAGSMAVGGLLVAMQPARWPFLLVPLWLFLRMALNAIDGMLAREHGQRSRLGALLNEMGDVVSDAALYWPFAVLAPFGAALMGFVVLLAALSEFAGVLGPTIGASRRYDGPMGKSDRALVFGAIGAWTGFGLPLPDWSAWVMIALAALLVLTTANRLRGALAEAGRQP